MATNLDRTVALGDLVAAAYDGAAELTDDAATTTHLAALAVTHTLLRCRNIAAVRKIAEAGAARRELRLRTLRARPRPRPRPVALVRRQSC
jgi:hypothetical protein